MEIISVNWIRVPMSFLCNLKGLSYINSGIFEYHLRKKAIRSLQIDG